MPDQTTNTTTQQQQPMLGTVANFTIEHSFNFERILWPLIALILVAGGVKMLLILLANILK